MPCCSFFHVIEVKPRTLVVGRIEPEHAGKHFFCVPEPAEAPEAEAVAVETAEEGTVVGTCPGEEAVEVLPQGEFPDLHPHVIGADCHVGIMGEGEVPQVGVSVQAAKIGSEEVHEDTAGTMAVARLGEVDGFEDGVRIRDYRGPRREAPAPFRTPVSHLL